MYRPPLHKPNGEIVDSDHLLPKGWWDDHSEDIGEPHTGKQLEEWFNKNHKCVKCGKIIRTHEQAKLRCKSSPQSKERIRMPNHNNTTELEKLLNDMCNEVQNNSSWTMLGGDPPDLTPYLTQLQNLTIKERQAELAQTVLAGMPELTPKQQEFVENRLQALEKTLKENSNG